MAGLTINNGGILAGLGTFTYYANNSTGDITNNGTDNITITQFDYNVLQNSTTAKITPITTTGKVNIILNSGGNGTGIVSAGTFNITGSLTIQSNGVGYTFVVDNTSNNANFNVGSLVIGTSTNTRYSTFKPGTGTIQVNGDLTIYASDGSGDNKIDSTGVNTPWTITGNVALSDTWIAGSSAISVAGNWDSSAGTFGYGTATVHMTGDAKTLKTADPNHWGSTPYIYNLVAADSGKTTTLQNSIVIQTLALGGGTLNRTVGGLVEVLGDGTPVTGTWTSLAGIQLQYRTVNNTATTIAAGTYDVLCFNPLGNPAFGLVGDITVIGQFGTAAGPYSFSTNGHNMTVPNFATWQALGGTVTINTDGSTINATNVTIDPKWSVTAGNSTWNVAGTWANSGTFTAGTSIVNLNAASPTTQTLQSNSNPFNIVSHGGTGTVQLTDALTLQDLNVTGGTLDANGQNISAAGNWNLSGGTFSAGSTPGTQTVNFIGTTETDVTGNTTFNNLTINTAAYGAKTVKFTANSNQTIPNTGALVLTGTTGKTLTLDRLGGSGSDQWTLTLPTNLTDNIFTAGTNITVSNSKAVNATVTPTDYSTVVEGAGANNTGWRFDTTAPAITLTASPVSPNGTNGYYKTTAPTVAITADDQGESGVASRWYRWGGSGDYTEYSVVLTAPEGTNILYSYAIDNGGHSGLGSPTQQEYKVDTIVEVVDIYTTPTDPNGTNGYYKTTAPSVTLGATDTGGSGVGPISYKWDSGSYAEYSTALTPAQGTHNISYYGTDLAGNSTVSTPVTREYKVDSVVPTASLAIDPAAPNGDSGYYTGTAPTVTLSGADVTSGLASVKYKWDSGSEYLTYDTPLTVAEGTHDLYYYSVDNAGNDGSASPTMVTYKVDLTAPTLTGVPTATSPTNNLTVNFLWDEATDGASGLDSYLVTIGSTSGGHDIANGVTALTNSYTKTFTSTGTYYIRVQAKDLAGNVSDYGVEGSTVGSSVVVDRDVPLITIGDLTEGQFVTAKTITLSGTASDQLSGLSKIQLQIDNGALVDAVLSGLSWSYNWTDYTEGNHTIKAKAFDNAGNEAYSSTFAIIVDTTAPTIPADFRGFNVSNVPASVYATYIDFAGSIDDTSGIKSYEIWKGGTKLADVPITKDTSNTYYTGNEKQSYFLIDSPLSSGKFSYKIKATDNAGNVSETPDLSIDTAGKAIETDSITDPKGNPSSVVTATKTSSIITWKTVYPATSYVEYGESASYGSKTEIDNNMNQGHSVLLPDLKPATTYHAKVKSHDLYGKDLESSDFTFTTKEAPQDQNVIKVIINALQSMFRALSVGAVDSGVTSGTATTDQLTALQGFSNNLLVTDVSFKEKGYFGNVLAFEKGKKIEKSTDDKSYSTLSSTNNYYFDKDIKESITYYYRLDGGNSIARKPVVGDDTTLAVKDAQVIKESVQSSKDAAQLTVSWTTNRGSSSQVEFGASTSYGQKTKEDTSLNMGHNVIIESLTPDTTYHFRVTSKDAKGNIAISPDFTFQTPTAQKDKTAIDVIFESFQKVWNSITGIF